MIRLTHRYQDANGRWWNGVFENPAGDVLMASDDGRSWMTFTKDGTLAPAPAVANPEQYTLVESTMELSCISPLRVSR